MSTKLILAGLADQLGSSASNGTADYIIAGILSLLILGYLLYTLIKPEKF